MIHIDIEQLELPEGWEDRAHRASRAVRAATPEARSSAIESRANTWTGLRDRLAKLSNDKCWYCESLSIRAEMSIDHFRPKNAVKECPSHPGYWWLAFSPTNYRLACKFCNELRRDEATGETGGKGSHFPLMDETKRVFQECDTSLEEPELLDPTVVADCMMLTFDLTGKAKPMLKADHFPSMHRRATTSIERYHLNHPKLKEQRQLRVCHEVSKKVRMGKMYWRLLTNGDSTARLSFNDVADQLRSMLRRDAPYSATARASLKAYRREPWVDALLTSY